LARNLLRMCTLTLNTVVSVAPIIGVLVAAWALIYQIRRSRFALNVELSLKLEDRFNSSDFEKIRSNAARPMLKQQFLLAENVFDFFDTLGYLVRCKAVDKEIIWSIFFHWAHGYWSAGSQYIARRRQNENDQTLWEDFEYLHNELLKLHRRKGNRLHSTLLNKKEITEFLEEES